MTRPHLKIAELTKLPDNRLPPVIEAEHKAILKMRRAGWMAFFMVALIAPSVRNQKFVPLDRDAATLVTFVSAIIIFGLAFYLAEKMFFNLKKLKRSRIDGW